MGGCCCDFCDHGWGGCRAWWMCVIVSVDHFDTKLGMVMQHHEPECPAEKLVICLQCQGHSEGLYNQNMTVSTISSKLLVRLQPNFV